MTTPDDHAASPALQPWQRPPFQPGHELSIRHGAFSVRRVGERAEVVRAEMLELMPHLAAADMAAPLAAYCRATAREELAHEAIEGGRADSPRLLEAASAAARVARELGDALGIGPRARAELQSIEARTALDVGRLVQLAPSILEALRLAGHDLGGDDDEVQTLLAAFAHRLGQIGEGE